MRKRESMTPEARALVARAAAARRGCTIADIDKTTLFAQIDQLMEVAGLDVLDKMWDQPGAKEWDYVRWVPPELVALFRELLPSRRIMLPVNLSAKALIGAVKGGQKFFYDVREKPCRRVWCFPRTPLRGLLDGVPGTSARPIVTTPDRYRAPLWEPLDWYTEAPAESSRIMLVQPLDNGCPVTKEIEVPSEVDGAAFNEMCRRAGGDLQGVTLSRGGLAISAMVITGTRTALYPKNAWGVRGPVFLYRPSPHSGYVLDARPEYLECWRHAVTDAHTHPRWWKLDGRVNNGEPIP